VRQLADWGADVIKIEAPSDKSQMGGPRAGPDFQNLHRNKRSLTLNLKSAEGKKIFMELAQKADVIVENFRPDVKHRLGIDYDSLAKHNQGLSMHLFPVLDRMGRWPTDLVLTRSRKAWGG
jgi:crotonobetainyl-CoA:carnitine CoA-transferase CaiB-like acyl-CoA transferase